ncbi:MULTISPECIES: type IV-A pilus assembly ATPase PilB [Vitreoscilla]|uniref:Type IV-A pilus assembly ATPase PilB n=1 Tax=Vitreoscilla stercoraria TaxID=61 RepID=A0ABY4EAI6_VITST|nr:MULTISPECIES: type IV-A pilus assembly ATPase PilB [Vitreoscilla]QJQ52385.1 type 2 secretion system protein E [Vitreoscilla sp. C1]UOO92769.1 type IV-A pilus assembly ATPase PilB [Vitreoscilla stercoraria]
MDSGLLRILAQQKIITDAQISAFESKAQADGRPIVAIVLQEKIITSQQLAHLLAHLFGCPLFDLSQFDQEKVDFSVITTEQSAKFLTIPLLQRGRRLTVAVADPSVLQALQKATFSAGVTIDMVVVPADQLLGLIERLGASSSTNILDDFDTDLLGGGTIGDEKEEEQVEDGPIAKFVHKVLLDALKAGASDIHFEFYEKVARVRLRVDGQLRELINPPIQIREQIASRIKVMSSLDISERRIPQDGRIKLKVSDTRAIDFRVSTLPTLFGEKIVMRILDSTAASLNVDQLGFEDFQKEILLDAINRPYGMVLVTGPTGSGKTVSLYTCLNILNTPDVNISTAEDPAEINLPGINQVNVNDKQGLTFSAALKSFLRQDPDIIMVGEIRDLETADIAIKAAQTGHMVFSTLHTNNAPATLSRMLNMGVAPFNIASSVNLIMAQRLLRRLCGECKAPVESPPDDVLKKMGFTDEMLTRMKTEGLQFHGPVGCDRCRGGGYKGRLGVYELMPISSEIQRAIMKNATAVDIADIAYQEGMVDLRRAGLLKVMNGLTSLEEVVAGTND